MDIQPIFLLQEQSTAFSWTYIWLAAGGVLFLLAVLAFAYFIAKRHWAGIGRLIRHPLLQYVDEVLSSRSPRLWGFIRARFSVHQWRGLGLTVAAGLIFGALYAFGVITESWTSEAALYDFDQSAYEWMVEAANPTVLEFMRTLTHLGDGLTITVLSLALAGVLLIRRYRWRLVELVLAMGVGAAVMWGLKMLFGRARPLDRIYDPAGHSFPSGHAFMSAVFYGFCIYLTWRLVRIDGVRITVTILLAMVILAIGLSRVILRVHWVSDVIGGFTAGLAWLVCSLIIAQALRFFRRGRQAEVEADE